MSLSQVPSQDMFMSDMHLQQHYPVYRPVFHNRTDAPATIAPRQTKDLRALFPEQDTQVIVPSMSALMPTNGPFVGFYPTAYYPFHSYPLPRQGQLISPQSFHHATVAMHTPIHHTLENATIAYDTVVEQNLQKDLVKDVFFSPAMTTPPKARDAEGVPSEASVCGSLQSDCESDTSSTARALVDDPTDERTFSPHFTSSDLLQDDDPLFFIGLDFVQEEAAETKKKPALSLNQLDKKINDKFLTRLSNVDLPTPPASTDDEHVQLGSLKRRRVTDRDDQKRAKHSLLDSTPPASPGGPLAFEDHYGYFDDASAEESSDDDDSQDTLTTRRLPKSDRQYGYDPADFHSISTSDDNESTTSWEQFEGFDDTASEDEAEEQQEKTHVHPLVESTPASDVEHEEKEDEKEHAEKTLPRPTAYPTIYQKLTKANVDWCRYCGTTEGVNWRPGPWGKRTLCNKHGCDYKGYGFACKLPRLDLTGFLNEAIDDRDRPVLQLFCAACHKQESWVGNVLVRCEGCPKALHQKCAQLTDEFVSSQEAWFCDVTCRENARKKRIVVELPRKRLPLMCTPKNNPPATIPEGTRTRSTRESR